MKKSLIYSKSKYIRSSAKKVRPVADLVRGKNVDVALTTLKFNKTKAGGLILKTLKSAIANARHNLNINEKDLFVSEIYIDEGPTFKSGRFGSRSNFYPILKRTSHIVVGLAQKEDK